MRLNSLLAPPPSPSLGPSGSKSTGKKARAEKRKHFSPIMNLDEILTSSEMTPLHVVVLFADSYDSLKDNDIDYVEQKLLNYVRKEISKRGQVLRYEKTERTKNGWLLITCADEDTAKWTTRKFIPIYKGNKFRIIRARDLPNYLAIEIVIPTTGLDHRSMLKMIEQQNSGLKTSSWVVLNERSTTNSDENMTIVDVKIPVANLPILRKLQWKPYFEFSRASITKCMLIPEKKKFVKKLSGDENSWNDAVCIIEDKKESEIKRPAVKQREFDCRNVYWQRTKPVERSEPALIPEVILLDSDDNIDEPAKSPRTEIDRNCLDSITEIVSISDDEYKEGENDPASAKAELHSEESSDLEITLSDSDENENSELCKALRQSIRKERRKSPNPDLNSTTASVEIILSDSDSEIFLGEPVGKKKIKCAPKFQTIVSSSDEDVIEVKPNKNVILISDDESLKGSVKDLKRTKVSTFNLPKKVARRPQSISLKHESVNLIKTEKAAGNNASSIVSPMVVDVEDDSSVKVITMEGETFIVGSETDVESIKSLVPVPNKNLLAVEGESFIVISETSQESNHVVTPKVKLESVRVAGAQEPDVTSPKESNEGPPSSRFLVTAQTGKGFERLMNIKIEGSKENVNTTVDSAPDKLEEMPHRFKLESDIICESEEPHNSSLHPPTEEPGRRLFKAFRKIKTEETECRTNGIIKSELT